MAARPGFESHLGKLADAGVTSIGGTNTKDIPGAPLTSQDAQFRDKKLQAPSGPNMEVLSGDPIIKLDPKDIAASGSSVQGEGFTPEVLTDTLAQQDDWLRKAQDAYSISDAYFTDELKPKLEDNIRAFNSEHKKASYFTKTPAGWSSKIYVPKTRTVIRKHMGAADIAFFSNQDIVSIEPLSQNDAMEHVAVDLTKALLQYRMRKTVPWYKLCLGAYQDALVQGIVCGHITWTPDKDQPEVKVFALDDFRIDPSADWMDPVNSSPYFITLRSMTIGEYKDKVAKGHFMDVGDGLLLQAVGDPQADLQRTRDQSKSTTTTPTINDYKRITIQEHIHRVGGQDYIFYTLGTLARISAVLPIEEIYFHGRRPYVLGLAEIESHRVFASGFPEILAGPQEEANELTNQMLNNIKLLLNKKFVIKSDSQIDLAALLRNQPGSAVFTDDPATDVRELETPDIAQSSFLQVDKLNSYFDELAGNFNPSSTDNRNLESGKVAVLDNGNKSILIEYSIRNFTQTWICPMIELLALTERHYETNPKLLELMARNIGIVKDAEDQTPPAQAGAPEQLPGVGPEQKNPMPRHQDFTPDALAYCLALLKMDLNIQPNVGMNATDPMLKLQKLIGALQTGKALVPGMTFDRDDLMKELLALAGYADGMRFINTKIDPKDMVIRQLQMSIKMQQAREQQRGQNQKEVAGIHEHGANLRKAAEIEQQSKELKAENAQFVAEHSLEMQQHLLQQTETPAGQKPPG